MPEGSFRHVLWYGKWQQYRTGNDLNHVGSEEGSGGLPGKGFSVTGGRQTDSAFGASVSVSGGDAANRGGNVAISGGDAGGTTNGVDGGYIEITPGTAGSGVAGYIALRDSSGTPVLKTDDTGFAFFNATPIAQPAAYTISGDTARRTLNPTTITLQQLGDFVATLAKDFGASGAGNYNMLQ